jgi:hypothetical protein
MKFTNRLEDLIKDHVDAICSESSMVATQKKWEVL